MIASVVQAWRRRNWRADAAKLAAYDGLLPFKVVTGGSDGIGFALASEFVRLDDHVLLVARDPARLDAAAVNLRAQARSGRIECLSLDVTAANACDQLDRALATRGGYCDVLVNAAGIGAAGTFATEQPARLDALVALNVAALTKLTHHVMAGQLIRGRGGILNVASLGGYAPGPYQAAYYASKSYVLSLTEALAYESRGQGVRIAVVAPGPVRTAFHARMNGQTGLYLKLLPVPSAQRVARTTLLRFRIGQRVILPGIVVPIMMVALRLLPHSLTAPIVAFLLKPRG